MGETNQKYIEGWRAFERGWPLHLGLKSDTDFANGWLEAMRVAFDIDKRAHSSLTKGKSDG